MTATGSCGSETSGLLHRGGPVTGLIAPFCVLPDNSIEREHKNSNKKVIFKKQYVQVKNAEQCQLSQFPFDATCVHCKRTSSQNNRPISN